MTLPITDSMLRGELRPNILKQSLEPKDLEQLIRNARKITLKSQLMELEYAINEVLGEFVNTADIYAEDRKTRNAAIKAHKNKIFNNKVLFKYIRYEVIIDNVLPLPELNSPLLRFYNTILDAELLRTRQALLYLSRSVQDDVFMRSTLKEVFRKIRFACLEASQWKEYQDVMGLIPIKLTHLYFSLLNTYGELLDFYDNPEYEDDFMDFVYSWKGEYPLDGEQIKYKEQCRFKTEIANIVVDMHETDKPQHETSGKENYHSKDKADLFLDAVAEYNFLEMPMIKQLHTIEKVHDLVMNMLDNYGHACAMLEHLKFFDWIKKSQRANFNKEKYDTLCSKIIMGKENSSAFHNVRISLNPKNKNAEKYRAYAYIDQVADEYLSFLNN